MLGGWLRFFKGLSLFKTLEYQRNYHFSPLFKFVILPLLLQKFSQRSSQQRNSSWIPVGIMIRISLCLIFTTILNEIKDIPSIGRGNKQGQDSSSPHGLRSRSWMSNGYSFIHDWVSYIVPYFKVSTQVWSVISMFVNLNAAAYTRIRNGIIRSLTIFH